MCLLETKAESESVSASPHSKHGDRECSSAFFFHDKCPCGNLFLVADDTEPRLFSVKYIERDFLFVPCPMSTRNLFHLISHNVECKNRILPCVPSSALKMSSLKTNDFSSFYISSVGALASVTDAAEVFVVIYLLPYAH